MDITVVNVWILNNIADLKNEVSRLVKIYRHHLLTTLCAFLQMDQLNFRRALPYMYSKSGVPSAKRKSTATWFMQWRIKFLVQTVWSLVRSLEKRKAMPRSADCCSKPFSYCWKCAVTYISAASKLIIYNKINQACLLV